MRVKLTRHRDPADLGDLEKDYELERPKIAISVSRGLSFRAIIAHSITSVILTACRGRRAAQR